MTIMCSSVFDNSKFWQFGVMKTVIWRQTNTLKLAKQKREDSFMALIPGLRRQRPHARILILRDTKLFFTWVILNWVFYDVSARSQKHAAISFTLLQRKDNVWMELKEGKVLLKLSYKSTFVTISKENCPTFQVKTPRHKQTCPLNRNISCLSSKMRCGPTTGSFFDVIRLQAAVRLTDKHPYLI